MRVLICGDREWTNWRLINDIVRECLRPRDTIIEGCARGADRAAEDAGKRHNIPVKHFPANWNRDGKRAGPIRNALMLRIGQPDAVWAFHNDIENSKGTKHMVTIARKAGIPVEIYSG